MELSGHLHAQVDLTLGKQPLVPILYVAGWALEPVGTLWRTEESLMPAGNRTPVVQAVAHRYTD
jgi:hypothetical protein